MAFTRLSVIRARVRNERRGLDAIPFRADLGLLASLGSPVGEQTFGWPLLKLTISQVAPILPYLFLVLILIFRPKGLLGTRGD